MEALATMQVVMRDHHRALPSRPVDVDVPELEYEYEDTEPVGVRVGHVPV